jgi:hypothetical protein
MAFESLTDDKIADLLNCPKRLTNPQARSKMKDGHEQVNYIAVAQDQSGHKFEIYQRKNMREGMEADFSCGISWLAPNGETLTLKRYNGPNHDHSNHLEKARLGNTCHIHMATEKYRKAEGFAFITFEYTSIEGAFHCLVKDCKISGITTTPDNLSQTKLFTDEP